MSLERLAALNQRFRREVSDFVASADRAPSSSPPSEHALPLLESMLLSRHLDRAALQLRESGHGHYTIGSAGHECNAVLGRLTTTRDLSLVHYRSAAFQLERARQCPELDGVLDIALSLVASSLEPTSGGRHKVFGGKRLGIIPQTSTIASHLPRAVGMAFALERRERLGLTDPSDAIVLASFGDASINHSTALGALNAVSWVLHQNLKLPILFVCEDNGLGISVKSPPGWVELRTTQLPHVRRFAARGWEPGESFEIAKQAVEYCRQQRRPALLHLECVRLLGHAGSDVDTTYRTPSELEHAIEHDPLRRLALSILAARQSTPAHLLALDVACGKRVDTVAQQARTSPRLSSREQVADALVRAPATAVEPACALPVLSGERLTLARGIRAGLEELMLQREGALLFGEDVAKKGGVYGITNGLLERFGALRVFNTLLDEQTILGLALGASTLGLLPIPEIQYLAYLHNAEDQLRGEAATFRFFSNGEFENPMILRIAGLGYQKGFGGHFHNDNSLAVLRDIPGLIVAIPARADDALALLRRAERLATRAGRCVVLVEPIALYHRRDLATGDGGWLAQDTGEVAEFARARVYHPECRDLVIVTYGNGLLLSLGAAAELQREHGIRARVLDLRWLSPLPESDILEHAGDTGALLVVDECRRSGNVSEAIAALLLDAGAAVRFARVTSADCFIPLGEAAELVLLSQAEIVAAARRLHIVRGVQ